MSCAPASQATCGPAHDWCPGTDRYRPWWAYVRRGRWHHFRTRIFAVSVRIGAGAVRSLTP